MGVSIFNPHSKNPSMSFSCAACHGQNLFGTKVLGLSNRFPKANEIFILGKKALTKSNTLMFKLFLNPSKEDVKTYQISREAIKHVRLKKPIALGLDTSLAQVGLSLATRKQDEYATKMKKPRARPSQLDKDPADSKPAVWWNLKYKTRWLSDGSIVSGNPVHTNFLWNEIGRGVDLENLENWLVDNKDIVKDLTTYAFNTKAPRFNEFFPNRINIEKAKRGEKLFLKSCKGCHGIYEKTWTTNPTSNYKEQLATSKVWYHEKTPVIDIGTDPYRANGMKYFAKDLNRLKISKTIGTVVTAQVGYVPPPLVGIWARWPYFHNNSAPSLYAVLTPSKRRPKIYIAVPSNDKELDFDFEKNGYPSPSKVQEKYKKNKELRFNTAKKGMSNSGHTTMLLNQDGSPKFNHEQKLELIEFLKTL
jgi:mono/diheme cytochrome c family protein